jgi:hypothetical protein
MTSSERTSRIFGRPSRRTLFGALVAVAALVVTVPFTPLEVKSAKAASVGTGFCASSVDNATGVTSTVASKGDCVVSFATAPTTGTGSAQSEQRTWTVPSLVTSVSVLVVAGGGGGGSSHNCCLSGGGGGGGGVVVATNFAVTPGASITVRTGFGGNGAYCANGSLGGNSAFGTLSAIGGGWGQGCGAQANPGGSGGGAHYNANGGTSTQSTSGTASSGSNITAYGRAGGGSTNYNGAGGGGGGATQNGGAGGTNSGGVGGEGIANTFRTDTAIVYGSGGGAQGAVAHGAGGTNGGKGSGTSAFGGLGINGVNETGGGGGGGWLNNTQGQAAGRGGTGIVVVRYGLPPLAQPANVTAVPTPSRGKSVDISWSAVPNAVSYIVKMRDSACSVVQGTKSGITGTSTTVTRTDMVSSTMGDSTTYKVSVVAVGDGTNYGQSPDAQCVAVTTSAGAAIPTIVSQPGSVDRTAGQDVSLAVWASTSDGGELSYQWRKGGVAIQNATLATYTIGSASTSDTGSYTVDVTNTLAGISITTTSTVALVAVGDALTLTTPTNGLSGTADSSFSLPVVISGGRSPLSFARTGSLVNGLGFSTATGTISGTPTVTGSSTVSITVTDANGATATTSNFTISIGYASTSISLALASASPQYRITNRITATTSRAGSVNFKLDGTSISGCEAVGTSSATAVCDWVPVDLGAASLSAEFTPTTSTAYSNSSASLSTTVSGRAITVTPTAGQSKVFGDSEPVIQYSITSGSLYGLDTLTGALSRVPGEDAGLYSITGGTLSNSNYAITIAPVNFTISQATQSAVSLTTVNGVYATGLTLAASGGTGSGGYSFTVISTGTAGCSITSDILNATSPGTCTVIATRAASTNYLVASSGATTVTIVKATQSAVSLTSTSGTYNANISLTAVGGTGTGGYSFSVSDAGTAGCSIAMGPSLTSSSAGSCTVTASRAGDNNYEPRSSVATLVTFAKDTQNALTLRDNSGDLDTGITLSVSGGSGTGAVSYSVTSGSANCSITSGVVNARFAGSCTLTSTKASDTNYLQKQITNTLSFVKATQSSIQVTSTSGTYGTPIQLATTGGSGSGAVSYSVSDNGSASCVVIGTQLTFTSAGTCKVTATRDADSVFDARSSVSATITIDRSNQTPLSVATSTGDLVTGIIVSVTGGGGTGSVSTSVTSGTANCTLTAGLVTARNIGTCALSISKAGDTNFFSASATVTLTFAKALQSSGTVSSPTSSALGTGITLGYTGGTGNGAITYTLVSAGTAGCSITNGVLNASSGGKCIVTITKRGDDTYADQVVTTEFTFVDNSAPSTTSTTSTTTTTVAPAASTGAITPKTTSTTSTTVVPTTTVAPKKQVVPPSLVNTASAAGAATIGGKVTKAKTTRVNNQLVFTAGGFTVTLAGVNADGTVIPLSSDGLLEVKRGDMFRLDAQGFAPNSSVNIWMFSKTFLMDTIEVGPDGLVKSTLKVPKSVEDGLHHLVMVGVDRAKAEAKFEVGMNVGVPPKQWWYSRILIAIPISIAVFIGFWLPTSASRRRRRRTV